MHLIPSPCIFFHNDILSTSGERASIRGACLIVFMEARKTARDFFTEKYRKHEDTGRGGIIAIVMMRWERRTLVLSG